MQMIQHTIRPDTTFCEPSYILLDNDTLFAGINKTRLGMHVSEDTDARFIAVDLPSRQITWSYDFDVSARKKTTAPPSNHVCATPLIWQDTIFVASSHELACLDKKDGKKIWSIKFADIADIKLSIIEEQLYLVNGNLIQVIHPGTGKVMNKRKHRVKWFDSPVISYESRFFIATASSKIVELSGNLNMIHEYPYAGGWATACTPLFHGNLMVSGSYAGSITAFNLLTHQPEWSIRKKAGAAPLQTYRNGTALFYDGHIDALLRCITLPHKKTNWSLDLEKVQALHINSDDTFLAVYKSAEHTFNLGLFHLQNGTLKQHITKENAA
jgi:hypothetical protein